MRIFGNRHAVEVVAIILALCFGLALDMLCFATLVTVLWGNHSGEGLQFGSAQVLLAWGSVIGTALTSYVAYAFGKRAGRNGDED